MKKTYKDIFKTIIIFVVLLIIAYGPEYLAELVFTGAFIFLGYKLYMWLKRAVVQEQIVKDKMQAIQQAYNAIISKESITAEDVAGFKSMMSITGLKIKQNDELTRYLRHLEFLQQYTMWAEKTQQGNIQPSASVPLILEGEEKAYFAENCTIYKFDKETVNSGNVLIGSRVKIGGLPLYFGGSIPLTETHETERDLGKANFVITDRRIIVSGPKISYVIPLKSIFDIKMVELIFGFATQIMYDGRYSGNIYRMENSAKCLAIAFWRLEISKEEEENVKLSSLTPEAAVEHWQKKVRENPNDAESHYKLGQSYVALCKGSDDKARSFFDEIIKAFKEAVRIKPDYFIAYTSLGYAYLYLGDDSPSTCEEAIKACKTAINLNAGYAEHFFLLGLAYMKLCGLSDGKTDAAPETYWEIINAFKEGIKIEPDWCADIYGYIATAYGILSEISKDVAPTIFYEEMIKTLKEALRLEPDSDKAHTFLGVAYLLMDNKDKAIVEYEYLKARNPEMAKELLEQIEGNLIR